MKKTRMVERTIEETVGIYCNNCSASCEGHIGNFNGLIEVGTVGAYDSTHLNDGDVYRFSLCEACLKSVMDKFQIPALVEFEDEK